LNPCQQKTDAAQSIYLHARMDHWNRIADRAGEWQGIGGYYHKRVEEIYGFLIPPGMRVLELGCGRGNLLASLAPVCGVGIDLSGKIIEQARKCHPELRFIEGDAHALPLDEKFDVVILSDLVNELWDVQKVFHEVAKVSTPTTRVVLNFHSHLWEQPLNLARWLRLASPQMPQNWLTAGDLSDLLALEDFEVIKHSREILCPLPIWPLTSLCNRYLVKIWPFRHLAVTNFLVARPRAGARSPLPEPVVSVVVPARNEAGNIAAIFDRTPEMGSGTELIFVEGNSQDDTFWAIEREMANHPERRCKLLKQPGRGKGDAVRCGFQAAHGDVLMILDADMTVPPEDLPGFYSALQSGKGEFINGVRLVYPMEQEAMRFLNKIGNKFFSLSFSWLLDQPIKDTLCGTKVLHRKDYQRISANRSYFGEFDPFGDFDLLFGAAKLNLKMIQIPIRYRERTYGNTNISRFRHGLLLLRMVLFAARKIKFI